MKTVTAIHLELQQGSNNKSNSLFVQLLEKFVVSQLAGEFADFNGNRSLISVLSVCHDFLLC
jgi:hypothetical protein